MNRFLSFLLSGFLLFWLICFDSCKKEATITTTSDTTVATIIRLDTLSCTTSIVESLYPNGNFAMPSFLGAFSWTDSGTFNTGRALFQFTVPPILNPISSVTLSLFFSPYGKLNEQAGENGFTIYQLDNEWNKLVTWNNQPGYLSTDSVVVPKTTSENQSIQNIDITNLFKDVFTNNNYGFMIKLNNEIPYAAAVFGSNYNIQNTLRPKIVIFNTP